jgi:hypothetical protein
MEISQLYKSIEQQIEKSTLESTDELKWIERSFGMAMKTWVNIEETASNYQFLNRQEEIYFYKTLKPGFTGLLEYFTLLYKSAVFQPEDSTKRSAYWKHELMNCRESISTYTSGCLHYEQQQSETDIHFLQQNNQQPLLFGLNASRLNVTTTSYSHSRSRLIAMKRYEKYIEYKMDESTGSLTNQPFFESQSFFN